MKPKIFITCVDDPAWGFVAFAIAQDGVGLKQHASSTKLWSRSDMGLTMASSPAHRFYREHYPEGYELVDYIDATDETLEGDPTYMLAHKLNLLGEPNPEPTDADKSG